MADFGKMLEKRNAFQFSFWRRFDAVDDWFAGHPTVKRLILAILLLVIGSLVVNQMNEFPPAAY